MGGQAAKATNTLKALVWIELLYAMWQSRNNSAIRSNGRLARAGVSQNAKYRALRELEAAGLVRMGATWPRSILRNHHFLNAA